MIHFLVRVLAHSRVMSHRTVLETYPMPGSVAESTGGTQPNPCAIQKGGAQSSGALGCRSQDGGVTHNSLVVKEMENSLLTLH